jgi:hypothetical protein
MASARETEPMPMQQYEVDYLEVPRNDSTSPLFILRALRGYSMTAKYYIALWILSTLTNALCRLVCCLV